MRTVGHRRARAITFSADARALIQGARFNDELQRLPTGRRAFFPKGVYRYRTHTDANAHWLACLAEGMARAARERE